MLIDPVRVPVDDRGRQDLHVAGQHHQFDPRLVQHSDQCRLLGRAGLRRDGEVVVGDAEMPDELGVVGMVGGHQHQPARQFVGVPAPQQVDQAV